MTDLSTSYLGLKLANPLVASASPISKKIDNVRRLEEAGIGAVVVYSLFEELTHDEKEREHFLTRASNMHPEAQDYFPDLGHYNLDPNQYLTHLTELRKAVKIPVIGSLNGVTRGGWTEWARRIEEAGVDALELNVYVIPTDPSGTGLGVEAQAVDLVAGVVSKVRIPVAGAKAVVLFNRFLQPDLDPENLAVVSTARLSNSSDLAFPLRWTALLCGKVVPEIALSGGIHSGRDLLKALLAGAQVGQAASEILTNGTQRAGEILHELASWMDENEYLSVDQLRGSMSQRKVVDSAAFERAQYMRALVSLDDRFI